MEVWVGGERGGGDSHVCPAVKGIVYRLYSLGLGMEIKGDWSRPLAYLSDCYFSTTATYYSSSKDGHCGKAGL